MIRITISMILLTAVALHTGGACAQGYPNKPVRVIVPQSVGDSCDVLSRLIGQKVGERLGQQFTVDNRPGAGGQLGLQLLTKSAPDGYTIACGQGGNMVIVPLAHQKVAYDTMRDFAPIQIPVSNFLALVVHPSVPFKNVKDLVAYGKANPGKLAFGSNGEGAFIHFSVELLRTKGGFTYLHVPYKSVSSIVIAPAGTPREIVLLLNREMNRAVTLPDVREKLDFWGLEIHTESPEFFTDVIRRDFEKWGKLARDIGFKPL